MVRKPSRKGAVWSLGKWPLASRVQRASVSCKVAPTPMSRLTARESPLIITTREKEVVSAGSLTNGRNRHLLSHVTNFSFYHPGAGVQPQLRRYETFNSQGVRSTLKIGLERFCRHFQGDSFTPPAEKAF